MGWLLAGAVALAACGGATAADIGGNGDGGGSGSDGGSSADGGSGGDGSAGDDAGGGGGDSGGGGGDSGGHHDSGGGSPACPASPPQAGTSCPVDNATCEYGDNPNEQCNTVAICNNGRWTLPPRSCAGGMCPTSYASVPKGQTCSPEGLDCAYPEGQCNCTRSGPVVRQEPAWVCTPTSAGCPAPRPDLGTACSQPGLVCDYGGCSGGVNEICKDGYWQDQPTPCPL